MKLLTLEHLVFFPGHTAQHSQLHAEYKFENQTYGSFLTGIWWVWLFVLQAQHRVPSPRAEEDLPSPVEGVEVIHEWSVAKSIFQVC
jgi:hypothetical protein